ncbi:MAG: DNA translocase FtsK, partial [Clostridia bacterium]
NLPSRISFKLSNGIDSKTVLDETGSEKLLGNGDMFYKPVFENTKVRVQGCYISGKEVEEVVEFVKTHNQAEYDETIKSSIIYTKKEESKNLYEDEETQLDDKFIDALKLAIENSQISISMIQRRYKVGYNRAGIILDTMEKMGYVSSFNGSKPREVYITKEQFEKDFGEF